MSSINQQITHLSDIFKEYKNETFLKLLTKKKPHVLVVKKLSEEQLEELWKFFFPVLSQHTCPLFEYDPETSDKNLQERSISIFSITVDLITEVVNLDKIKENKDLIDIILLLQSLLNIPHINISIKDKIFQICEKWCINNLPFRSLLAVNCFSFILNMFEKTPNKKNILRLYKFHHALVFINFKDEKTIDLKKRFLQCAINDKFLESKEGQKFISHLFTLDVDFSKELFAIVKKELPEMSPKKATSYGFIFCNAWLEASTELNEFIQEHIIQNLMYHFLSMERSGAGLTSLGSKIFGILGYFHKYKNNISIQTMLTEMYAPLLWRNLKSISGTCRANAIQLLGSAYPLEHNGAGRAANEDLREKQHGHIHQLLKDPSHIVRILAIEAVGNILTNFWSNVSHKVAHLWLTILVRELAHDSSSWRVRNAVFLAFGKMATQPLSAVYLNEVIPSLLNCLHDVNENIRLTFVNMIITLKNGNHITNKNIIPINHFLARLELENRKVGGTIANYLFDEYASPDFTVEEFGNRLAGLIINNLEAARNIFLYGPLSSIPLETIINFIGYLIKSIGDYAKSTKVPFPFPQRIGTEDVNKTNPKNKAKRSRKEINENQNENNQDVESKENIPEDLYQRTTVENPFVAQGYLDIAYIFWMFNSQQIIENPKIQKKLYALVKSLLPILFDFYKGHRIIRSILCISSLMPLNTLEPSIPVISICLDLIDSLPDVSNLSEDECLDIVSVLCNWKKASIILKKVTDWLDLNQTQPQTPLMEINTISQRNIRNKRRSSIAERAKPLVALTLLEQLITYEPNTACLLKYHNENLIDFINVFENVKKFIMEDIQRDPLKPPTEIYSLCWNLFIKYLELLKNCENYDATNEYLKLLQWCQDILIPSIPERIPAPNSPLPCSVRLLQKLFKLFNIAFSLENKECEIFPKLIHLSKAALQTGYGLYFVSVSSTLAKDSIQQSKYSIIPCLTITIKIIDVLIKCKLQPPDLQHYIQNHKKVRDDIGIILLMGSKTLGPFESHITSILGNIFEASLKPIYEQIQEDEDVVKVDNLDELPFWTKQFLLIFKSNKSLGDPFGAVMCSRLLRNNQYKTDKLHFLTGVSLLFTLSYESCSIPNKRMKLALDILKKIHSRLFPENLDNQAEDESSQDFLGDASEKMLIEIKRKLEVS